MTPEEIADTIVRDIRTPGMSVDSAKQRAAFYIRERIEEEREVWASLADDMAQRAYDADPATAGAAATRIGAAIRETVKP